MSWRRRWGVVTLLILVQAAIVVCYQGVLTGNAAPVAAQEPPVALEPTRPGEKEVSEVKKVDHQGPEKRDAVDPVPAVAVPLPLINGGPDLPAGAAPAPLPKDLPADAITPVPTAPPPPPKKEDRLMPVAAQGPPDVLPGPLPKTEPEKKVEKKLPEAPLPPAPHPLPGSSAPTPKPRSLPSDVGLPPVPDIKPVGGVTPPEGEKARTPTPPAPQPPAPKPPVPAAAERPPAPVTPMPSSPDVLKPQPMGQGGSSAARPGPDPLVQPAAPTQTNEPPAPDAPCPWVLRVEIVKGRTLMTAQTGKEVQFRVSCDKLELAAPRGSILATGNVTVSSDGLDGSCDQLTISWQVDQVILEGKAELKCRREGQEVDLKGAKLSLRLTMRGSAEEPNRVGPVRGARSTTNVPADWISRGKQGNAPTGPAAASPGAPATPPTSTQGVYIERYYGTDPPPRKKAN